MPLWSVHFFFNRSRRYQAACNVNVTPKFKLRWQQSWRIREWICSMILGIHGELSFVSVKFIRVKILWKEWSVAVDRNDQSLKSRKSIKFGIDFFKRNLFYESVWLHLWQKHSMEMIVGRIKYVLLLAEMNMDREKKETGVYFNAMWVALRATLHFIDTCSHGTTMPPFFTRELAELVQCFVANFN